jgi:hypothetical protein
VIPEVPLARKQDFSKPRGVCTVYAPRLKIQDPKRDEPKLNKISFMRVVAKSHHLNFIMSLAVTSNVGGSSYIRLPNPDEAETGDFKYIMAAAQKYRHKLGWVVDCGFPASEA